MPFPSRPRPETASNCSRRLPHEVAVHAEEHEGHADERTPREQDAAHEDRQRVVVGTHPGGVQEGVRKGQRPGEEHLRGATRRRGPWAVGVGQRRHGHLYGGEGGAETEQNEALRQDPLALGAGGLHHLPGSHEEAEEVVVEPPEAVFGARNGLKQLEIGSNGWRQGAERRHRGS